MEIETCEQYVLDQLMCTENEVYQLRAANDELKARCAKLYRDGTGYRTSVSSGGSLIPFEDWCMEHVEYQSQRCGMTKTEFIAYFEPEFRAEYEELAEEWKAEQE